jgi:hypothetical protein
MAVFDKMRVFLVTVAVMLAAAGVRADEDRRQIFQQSTSAFQNGNFEQSRALLSRLVKLDPRNGMYWFNLGNCYYQLKNYRMAAFSYEKVETLGSGLGPAAGVYRAKALHAQGNDEQARRVVEMWIESRKLTPALQSIATDLRSELATGQAQKESYESAGGQAWAFLDFSLGHDSNAYLDPDTASSKTSSAYTEGVVGVGGRLLPMGRWSLMASYIGDWVEVSGQSSLALQSHQAQVYASLASDELLLQIGPYFQYDVWGSTPARNQIGARLRSRRSIGRRELGADLSAARAQSIDSSYSYLTGTVINGRLYGGLVFDPVYGQIFFDYNQQSTGDQLYSDGSVRPLANQGIGPGVRLLWRVGERWVLSPLAKIMWRKYSGAIQPSGKERSDNQTLLSLRVAYSWTSALSFYSAYEYESNRSTMDASETWDANYSNHRVLLGFAWDAL